MYMLTEYALGWIKILTIFNFFANFFYVLLFYSDSNASSSWTEPSLPASQTSDDITFADLGLSEDHYSQPEVNPEKTSNLGHYHKFFSGRVVILL